MFEGFTYFVKFCWKRQKSFLIFAMSREIFEQIIPIVSIVLPKFIIDGITNERGLKYIGGYILLYISINLLVTFLVSVFRALGEKARFNLGEKVEAYLSEIFGKMDYRIIESDTFLQKREMAYQYIYGGGTFGGIYDKGLAIIGNIISFVAIIGIIMTLNSWIVVFLVFLIVFNSFVKSRFNNKFYMQESILNKMRRRSHYIGDLLEIREYGKEIRINSFVDKLIEKFRYYNRITTKTLCQAVNYEFFLRNTRGISNFFQEGIVYFYLTLQVIGGAIGIGSFTMYINAVSRFSNAMMDVMNSIIEIKRIDMNYKDFDEFVNLPQKMREGKRLPISNPHDKHSIEFKDVWFKYPSSEKYILKNINIKIEAGEKLSVVGENGAGKTTFIKLLTRLYDPTKGEILFDGVDIKDLDYDEYMKALSVVFQDFRLFAFSIKENVTLKDNDEVSDEEVLKILEKSGLSENMKKFDKGIHTTVYKEFDDEGVELSGGEGQKLSIARALYKNGGIVVLDEPTAALDPRSEYEIYMRFNELIQGKTAIFISHRLSSSRFCDKVAVFENGEIKEYGTHNTLMNENGIYAELYNKQAQFYVDVE